MKKKQFMPELKKLAFIFFALFILKSCSDPCEELICLNGGACQDGLCLCPDFYSGPNCEIEERLNFLGTYTGTTIYYDSMGDTNLYADSKVITSSAQGAAYIKIDADVFASLNTPGSGEFNIPSQTPSNALLSNFYFSGSGDFKGDTITYQITAENNNEIVTMSFTGTK